MMSPELKKQREKNIESLLELRNELDNETDRGCCLMSASYLDFELERMLRIKLIGSKKHLDSLFDFNGSLGTFSSKINLSYSLGLISKTTQQDLNIIRKIRNEFGHSHKSLNFESEHIKKEVINLKSNFYKSGEIRSRGIFTNTVTGIMAEIHTAFLLDKKFEEKKESIITDLETKEKIKKYAKNLSEEIINQLTKK